MDDSTIFTVGMFLLPLMLGPAVILVLILVGRAAARRAARGGTSGGPVPPAARWGCGLSLLFGVCAFCGLMVATAGGAIHPPLVMVAVPYVCDGTVAAQSRHYSYRPGQRGIARNIYCIGTDGERRDVTLRAVGAATFNYTLICFAAALVLLVFVRLLRPRLTVGADTPSLAESRQRMSERMRTHADILRRSAAPPYTGCLAGRLRSLPYTPTPAPHNAT